jgi:hypothetical protein
VVSLGAKSTTLHHDAASHQAGSCLSLGAEAGHLCIGLLPTKLHLRERVGGWTPDHVAESLEGLDIQHDNDVQRLRRVCECIAASKRAVLRKSMEGSTLYICRYCRALDALPGWAVGRFVETLVMLSASSIDVSEATPDPLVATALSRAPTEAMFAPIETRKV